VDGQWPSHDDRSDPFAVSPSPQADDSHHPPLRERAWVAISKRLADALSGTIDVSGRRTGRAASLRSRIRKIAPAAADAGSADAKGVRIPRPAERPTSVDSASAAMCC